MSGYREVENEVTTELAGQMTYASYLDLDRLLSAQHRVSGHHDEVLFIIQHQVTELWLKLVIHELRSAIALFAADNPSLALKRIARIKHVQEQMFQQWAVLATLTPTEYLQFRESLGSASGFQSQQYRTVEFLLGNKNPGMLKVFAHDPAAEQALRADLNAPSLYDEFLLYLGRNSYHVPEEVLARDWAEPYLPSDGVVEVFRTIYRDPQQHWQAYETAEELVDIEERFQLWRFRHLKTVERIIGGKRGTGGSSGITFLARALDLTFFPELRTVRTELS